MALPVTGRPARSHADELRRARRAFVRTHHPDVGGDPAAFRQGLARFERLLAGPSVGSGWSAAGDRSARHRPGVVVVRRPRGIDGWVRHLSRSVARRVRPAPPRVR